MHNTVRDGSRRCVELPPFVPQHRTRNDCAGACPFRANSAISCALRTPRGKPPNTSLFALIDSNGGDLPTAHAQNRLVAPPESSAPLHQQLAESVMTAVSRAMLARMIGINCPIVVPSTWKLRTDPPRSTSVKTTLRFCQPPATLSSLGRPSGYPDDVSSISTVLPAPAQCAGRALPRECDGS
jgi:hypothetical protein